ncbi:MAG: NAD(P)H-hydrate dehydratase [Bacteroidales bacterium]|nr:NAD(P)H-hydrate dehydratase [Bacteroidales bacterium]
MDMTNDMQHPWVLTVEQTRSCERHTMEHEPIPSVELMERAGARCAQQIVPILQAVQPEKVVLFCGTGNNGGDGLVIARHLAKADKERKTPIQVVVCESEQPRYSDEMTQNLERWKELCRQNGHLSWSLLDPEEPVIANAKDLLIDAIFGIGLQRKVEGRLAKAIAMMNASDAFTIAIDIPSGLYADKSTPADHPVAIADMTLTIQYPKWAFFTPEGHPFYGEVRIIDIDMYPPEGLVCRCEYLTRSSVSPLLRPSYAYAHKGSQGHGLLVAGSAAMPGAAILAATAAMRGGIGKLTLHSAGTVCRMIPTTLPEAILHVDEHEQVVSRLDWETLPSSVNAVAIGPGLGTARTTVNVIKEVLDSYQAPLILDADALNMLADNKTWLAFLPPYSILTPHPKEFERLAGPAADHFERIAQAKAFAERYQVILILKGHHTLVSLPDGMQFFNTTGNSGMATAGSGDTLTGLLLALLAQQYNPVETALLGVYLHGLAGDLYIQDHAPQSLIASDLPTMFGKAFLSLTQTTRF